MKGLYPMEPDLVFADSRGQARLNKHDFRSNRSGRIYPVYFIYFLGKFFRILSVYTVYQYFSRPSSSVVIFSFICLSIASTVFLIVHRPWRGRPLTSYQLVPTIINGALMSLSIVLWGEGLRICGPVRTVMAEYVGAVLGAISTLILGRGGRKWKKVAGLVAMLASYFFLSQGWDTSTYSPFLYRSQTSSKENSHEIENIGFSSMSLVFLAGVLAGLNRVIGRRVSLKMQMKRRLYVVTVVTAACFLFPVAMFQATLKNSSGFVGESTFPFQPIVVFTVFGVIVSFYVDLMADERLHVSIASAKHLMVTTGCLLVLEFIYRKNFSPLGFLICASVLGLGIFESTSTDKVHRAHEELPTEAESADGIAESSNSLIMAPVLGSVLADSTRGDYSHIEQCLLKATATGNLPMVLHQILERKLRKTSLAANAVIINPLLCDFCIFICMVS